MFLSNKCGGISGSTLKLIAVSAMITDHIGAFVIDSGAHPVLYAVLRNIGRISFPIFCFLLVEGLLHTGNTRKYMLRLFIFALISEVPFDLVRTVQSVKLFNAEAVLTPKHLFSSQNVFFTLLLGLITIWLLSKLQDKYIICAMVVVISCIIAYFLRCDYSYNGIIQIVLFYYARMYKKLGYTLIGALNIYMNQPMGIAALPLIYLYNGKRRLKLKYLMYAVYPAHLIIIYLVVSKILV